MSDGNGRHPSRREVLSATARAASAPALAVLGAGRAGASEPSITFHLYPNSDEMGPYVEEAARAYRNWFAPQLRALGVDLSVAVASTVPDAVDQFRGSHHGTFQHHVETYTDNAEGGTGLHMWFNAVDSGGPRTPGGSLVDGQDDAFSDVSMTYYRRRGPAFRRNMYFHEALHAFVEEGRDDYACGTHDANDEEHTCGAVDVRRAQLGDAGRDTLRVTPLATSYDDDPDELGTACTGVPESYPEARAYVGEFSTCTVESLRRFFANNHR